METQDEFKKYLSLRDHLLTNPFLWIKGRATDDNCGDYWRVHNNLYDLTNFIHKHPGGKEWLELTRGTDVTEYFESFHLNPDAKRLLANFFRCPANGPRNAPYTFAPKGFYLTLKARVFEVLSQISEKEKKIRRDKVRAIHNGLLIILAASFIATGFTQSRWMAAICGIIASLMHNCTHSFVHKKNNWRRYCMDFGLYSSFEFRVSHCMSHHAYPNTIYDLECSACEPFADLRVYDKPVIVRLLGMVALLVLSQTSLFICISRAILSAITQGGGLHWENLLPLSEIAILALMGTPWLKAFELWLVIQAVDGYFITVIGLLAGHHHPDLYHMGDGNFAFGNDWGLAQLDAIRDRKDVNGSLLMELTLYGNHALHHLFPTVDHGLLDLIRPVFEETCKEFNLPVKVYRSHCFYNQFEFFVGYFRQLLRTTPRPNLLK